MEGLCTITRTDRCSCICIKADVCISHLGVPAVNTDLVSTASGQEHDSPHPKVKTGVRSGELGSRSTCVLSLRRRLRWRHLHCPCACGNGACPQVLKFSPPAEAVCSPHHWPHHRFPRAEPRRGSLSSTCCRVLQRQQKGFTI